MELSIVVPVYNSEMYLETTVNSLLQQDFKDIEIILVDDGSIDKSGELCDAFAEKDARIRVFHQKNKGVSAARNRGIAEACGKYITFVDADDWVEHDIYTTAMETIKKNLLDILVLGYTLDIGGKRVKMLLGASKRIKILQADDAIRSMLLNHDFSWNIGDKIYLTKIVKKHNFDCQIHSGEDLLFHFRVFSNAKKIGITNTYKYHYVQHDTSASHQRLSLKSLSVLDVFPRLFSTDKTVLVPVIESVYFKYCIGYSKRIKLMDNNHEFMPYLNRTMKIVRENFRRILLDSNIPIKHRMGAGVLFLPEAFWKLVRLLNGL